MKETTTAAPDQSDFLSCYRGRQTFLHHLAYLRMGKVLLTLRVLKAGEVNLASKSIFDYGFGAGTFFRFCPVSSSLFGVEVDPENVAAVREMLATRTVRELDLRAIDIARWAEHPLLARSYDVILCSHVLEHLPDPVGFLQRISRCLKPSGVFIGLVPINERRLDPHHVQEVDESMVRQWAKQSGLLIRSYLEDDPWPYWIQPVFASNKGMTHTFAQMISFFLGMIATMIGPRNWFQLGKLFRVMTGSHPTQAAFILQHAHPNPSEIYPAR